jgi:two-component system nitrate/nitrite response regulator NarL
MHLTSGGGVAITASALPNEAVDAAARPSPRPRCLLVAGGRTLLYEALALALERHGCDVMAHLRVVQGRPEPWCPGPAVDLVVMLAEPDGACGNGLATVAALCQSGARVLVIAADGAGGGPGVWLALGAWDVVGPSAPLCTVVDHVHAAAACRPMMSPGRRAELVTAAERQTAAYTRAALCLSRLTASERETLRALCDGAAAKEIAARSHTSLATVRTHIRNLLGKLDCHSQVAAVALARRAGWNGGHLPNLRPGLAVIDAEY